MQTTLLSSTSVLKANETTTHKTGRERQITITDNTIQSAANEAVLWCENTSQRINASKQYMMLTLKINAAVSPSINIKGETVQQMKTAKLLGVTIDQHLLSHQIGSRQNQVCRAWASHSQASWGQHCIAYQVLSGEDNSYSHICSSQLV